MPAHVLICASIYKSPKVLGQALALLRPMRCYRIYRRFENNKDYLPCDIIFQLKLKIIFLVLRRGEVAPLIQCPFGIWIVGGTILHIIHKLFANNRRVILQLIVFHMLLVAGCCDIR